MEDKSDPTDCLVCRVVSSAGLALAAAYIYRQSMNQKTKFNRNGMLLISAAFGLTSAARLFKLFPFNKQQQRDEYKSTR